MSEPVACTIERRSRFAVFGAAVALVLAVGCGGSSTSGLFNGGASPNVDAGDHGGAGGTLSAGAGGAPSSGDASDAMSAGGAGLTSSGGSSSALDSGAGASDSDHDGSAGGGGATSEAGTPGGAWARCATNADCTGGRVCTEAAQSILVSGRSGACVHHCLVGSAGCDPPLEVGTVTCTQLLVDSFCTISCGAGEACPARMDCVNGVCYYMK